MGTPALHKVVVAAIIERDGRILANQRPPGAWGAGKWEFPGGKVDVREDPREALVRECREELGVEVRAGSVYEILSHHYNDAGSVILVFFRTEVLRGEPRQMEGGAIAWVAPHEILALDWLEADLPLVVRWAGEHVK